MESFSLRYLTSLDDVFDPKIDRLFVEADKMIKQLKHDNFKLRQKNNKLKVDHKCLIQS